VDENNVKVNGEKTFSLDEAGKAIIAIRRFARRYCWKSQRSFITK
jgi:hypothetical protein